MSTFDGYIREFPYLQVDFFRGGAGPAGAVMFRESSPCRPPRVRLGSEGAPADVTRESEGKGRKEGEEATPAVKHRTATL